ncbi:putative hex2 protein [Phaeoacremonium minimum UCRPA7]|uniref:Putative hex2 protein n=1 Tax=Phaeoacremonium minimum (strain UCR-PA7) TaxID=1286976 RepID=R8BBX4_PHAM7|nr:putative hex2 protein [Phaeoacremonium minimum UCRPA7]EON96794.1 putative hex2 protein [Phaeoacremonium minimum UCRPA7]
MTNFRGPIAGAVKVTLDSFVNRQASFHTSNSASRIHDIYPDQVKVYGESPPSSAPSSPPTLHAATPDDLSYSSTPATNLSLADDDDDTLDLISSKPHSSFKLPDYNQYEEDLEPPSPGSGSFTPNGNDTSENTSRPDTPDLPLQHPVDDSAVGAQPSRHVDYLSHDWREEDIWSSWKYIISKKGDYSNAARLENASWRTWMKAKNKLKTVSPETLNWLKDCDVTWLYGPLQTGNNNLMPPQTNAGSSGLSKSNSFLGAHKKPILKKRTMSEVMLARSLSASSLLKQAAAAVQAQQHDGSRKTARPRLERSATDYITFPFSSRRMSAENTSRLTSAVSSGIISPSGERKHIHFNEQVEQCIAIDVKGNDEEDEVENDRFTFDDSDSSDDGAIMMKRTVTKKRRPILKRAHSDTSKAESKTIAMLPSTTLKYREDTPEPQETAMKHSNALYRSPILSPSSSQETLRPSKASGKFFFNDDDEDDEEDEEEEDNRFSGLRSPTKFGSSSGLHRSTSSGSLTAEPAGMRRTESGMFMPYEEGESAAATEGIFGRVIDTVNTARDIAHVIWNVGWRK